MLKDKNYYRKRRHNRVRKKVTGTTERPRLSIFRSLNQIYAQIIDDVNSFTIVATSTLDKKLRDLDGHRGNIKSAKRVGELIASKAKEKGITSVVFDKGGYKYHGRVKALADAAREAGLEF